MDIVKKYWKEGGTLQWFAQVSQDRSREDSWRKWLRVSVDMGATGTYLHGGVIDHWYANRMFDRFAEALELMRKAGTASGFAGHNPHAHRWISENLDADFQMCSHYNPSDRSRDPKHTLIGERWEEEDRELMSRTIEGIRAPH